MKTNNLTIRLNKQQREKIERIAKKERRTKTSLICNFIEDYKLEGEKDVGRLDKTA